MLVFIRNLNTHMSELIQFVFDLINSKTLAVEYTTYGERYAGEFDYL